jgi:hypothetical protein
LLEGTGRHGGAEPGQEEPEIDDLPIYDDLADPSLFKALARFQLQARPHVEALERLLNADPTIRRHIENADARARSVAVQAHRLVKVPTYKKWVHCYICHGKGTTPDSRVCMTCGGAGCLYE